MPFVDRVILRESWLFSPELKLNPNTKVTFSEADIYYFERAQGFTKIPTHGDIALGIRVKNTFIEII